MEGFSFAAVRQFRGDGRDINNISVSIASCYGSSEVEKRSFMHTRGTAGPRGIDVMLQTSEVSISLSVSNRLTARLIIYRNN